MKKSRRFLSAALALAICLTALEWRDASGLGQPAGAVVTQAQIDALKNNVQSMTGEIQALEAQLAQVRGDKEQALAQKKNLDDQMELLDRQIAQQDEILAQYDALLAEYDGMIGEKQAEVEGLQAKEAAQYALFCQRVRSMEEQGNVSYLSILFRAGSFAQLLDSAMLMGEIMDYDNGVIQMLQATRSDVERAKAELEVQRAEQQDLRSEQQVVRNEQEDARAQLQARREEADELVRQIMAQESEYQTALAQIEEEEERIQAEIVRLSKELAAQQAAANAAALGGYIWPVTSRRITSPFGARDTGIPGASTDHKGVDIGGVGYTTQVCAAKAGTVIISMKSTSYGNYVVVSHGDGNTTLYAHMSSRKVSVGDVVAQGTVLGITGNTGISRGAHLHFEITENGVRVDPLKYLTGYIKAW